MKTVTKQTVEKQIVKIGKHVRGLKISIEEFSKLMEKLVNLHVKIKEERRYNFLPINFVEQIKILASKLVISNADMEVRLTEKLNSPIHIVVEKQDVSNLFETLNNVGIFAISENNKNYSPNYYISSAESRANLPSLFSLNNSKNNNDSIYLINAFYNISEQDAKIKLNQYININWFEVYLNYVAKLTEQACAIKSVNCSINLTRNSFNSIILNCVKDCINEIEPNKNLCKNIQPVKHSNRK